MRSQELAGVLATALLVGCSTTATSEVSLGSVDNPDTPPGWICTETYCLAPHQETVTASDDKTVTWSVIRFRCPKYPVVVETARGTDSADRQ